MGLFSIYHGSSLGIWQIRVPTSPSRGQPFYWNLQNEGLWHRPSSRYAEKSTFMKKPHNCTDSRWYTCQKKVRVMLGVLGQARVRETVRIYFMVTVDIAVKIVSKYVATFQSWLSLAAAIHVIVGFCQAISTFERVIFYRYLTRFHVCFWGDWGLRKRLLRRRKTGISW